MGEQTQNGLQVCALDHYRLLRVLSVHALHLGGGCLLSTISARLTENTKTNWEVELQISAFPHLQKRLTYSSGCRDEEAGSDFGDNK